jgi:hypothetical protein
MITLVLLGLVSLHINAFWGWLFLLYSPLIAYVQLAAMIAVAVFSSNKPRLVIGAAGALGVLLVML